MLATLQYGIAHAGAPVALHLAGVSSIPGTVEITLLISITIMLLSNLKTALLINLLIGFYQY